MPILVNSVCAAYSKVWVRFLRVYRISSCFSQGYWLTVWGSHTFISSGLFPSRQRKSITPFGLRLKYIPLYRDQDLFVLSRDILYRPVIHSRLPSIAHYPTVYTPSTSLTNNHLQQHMPPQSPGVLWSSSVRQVSGSVVGDCPRQNMLFYPSDCCVTGNSCRGDPAGLFEMLYVLADSLPMQIAIGSGYVERSPMVAPYEGCNTISPSFQARPRAFMLLVDCEPSSGLNSMTFSLVLCVAMLECSPPAPASLQPLKASLRKIQGSSYLVCQFYVFADTVSLVLLRTPWQFYVIVDTVVVLCHCGHHGSFISLRTSQQFYVIADTVVVLCHCGHRGSFMSLRTSCPVACNLLGSSDASYEMLGATAGRLQRNFQMVQTSSPFFLGGLAT